MSEVYKMMRFPSQILWCSLIISVILKHIVVIVSVRRARLVPDDFVSPSRGQLGVDMIDERGHALELETFLPNERINVREDILLRYACDITDGFEGRLATLLEIRDVRHLAHRVI